MLSVNADGMVILAGSIQLFPLKVLWFYFIAGFASVFSYLVTSKERKIKGAVIFWFAGILCCFMISGAIRDIFEKEIADWISGFLGFFAYPILKKMIANTDRIVNALFNKVFQKLGIDERFEDKNDTKLDN